MPNASNATRKSRHSSATPTSSRSMTPDEAEGLRYIDMELIRGETLAARLGRRTRSTVRAPLGDRNHRKGRRGPGIMPIVPASSTATSNHRISCSTSGASRSLPTSGWLGTSAAALTLTVHGQVLGTPAYMSPEQAEGHSHEADERSDVFSLGVVLYRMLTGKLPFDGTDSLTTLLAQIAGKDPLRLGPLNPAIPKDLETICLKALEKRPADRFGSAGAFADELRRWRNREPLTIRPPTWWERLRRWSRRNRMVTRLTAASALLLLIVSLALGTTAWNQANRARNARLSHAIEAHYRAQTQVTLLVEQARQRLRTPTQGRRWETEKILRDTAAPLRLIPEGPEKEQLLIEIRSVFAATLAVPDIVQKDDDRSLYRSLSGRSWPVALHPDGHAMAIGTAKGPVRWERGKKPELPSGPRTCPSTASARL